MKINKYILGAGALLCMMLPAASAQAQDVKLKCMEWNIKSFEYDDNSNAVYFEIAEAMEKIKAENPDIVCFNEFETATGRMSSVEKLTECAQSLGMFPFFVFSYDKDAFGGDETCLGQAKEVIEHAIAPAVAENIPVLIMGDMNCGPSSSAIREYEKTGTRLCNNDGTFGGYSKLDYFISFPQGKWSCSDYKVVKGDRLNVISDHYPIAGTAVLKN